MSFWAVAAAPRDTISMRRLAKVGDLALVSIFSTSGRISLALASVVRILPRSTKLRASDLSSAERCPVLRPNFLFTLPCRIQVLFQYDAEVGQSALDLLDGLGAQALYLHEVLLLLARKPAYCADVGRLQGRDGARGELQVLNAGLERLGAVHSGGGRRRGAHIGCLGYLLLLKTHYGLKLGDHDFDGLLECLARRKRAVGLDGNAQAVKVGAVADAHIFYLVVDAAYRAEYRINRYLAYLDTVLFKRLARDVAQAALDGKLHIDSLFAGKLADVGVRVKQAQLARELKVLAGQALGALEREGYGLRTFGQYLEAELF